MSDASTPAVFQQLDIARRLYSALEVVAGSFETNEIGNGRRKRLLERARYSCHSTFESRHLVSVPVSWHSAGSCHSNCQAQQSDRKTTNIQNVIEEVRLR